MSVKSSDGSGERKSSGNSKVDTKCVPAKTVSSMPNSKSSDGTGERKGRLTNGVAFGKKG